MSSLKGPGSLQKQKEGSQRHTHQFQVYFNVDEEEEEGLASEIKGTNEFQLLASVSEQSSKQCVLENKTAHLFPKQRKI